MRYFIAFNKVELPFESSIYPGSFLILRRPIPFSECLNKKITVIFRITHLRLPLQLSVSMIFSTTISNVEHQNRNMFDCAWLRYYCFLREDRRYTKKIVMFAGTRDKSGPRRNTEEEDRVRALK